MTEPTTRSDAPRTVLICHSGDELNRHGLARWLAATTDLAGIVVLAEPAKRMRRRIQREIQRIRLFRFIDVLAFRFYYKLFLAKHDHEWEAKTLAELSERFPPLTDKTAIIEAASPNSPEVEQFIRRLQPDIVIARCKSLLKESVCTIPTTGTVVMHPGI